MLLHNPFVRLDGRSSIRLEAWDRAPLNLIDGSVLHIEPPRRPEPGRPIEVFISPFIPDCWGDLWHLEVSFLERVGVIAALFDLLRRSDVTPLAAETSTCASGERHKAVIVCDCRKYASSLDADAATRMSRELAELQGLRALVAAEFLEDLVFTNGLEPHLRLVRNAGHFRAYKRLQHRRREAQPAVIEDGRLWLPAAVVNHIRRETSADFSLANCMVVSDSSDRCLRLFLTSDQARVFHVRGKVEGESSMAVSNLLLELQRRKFDLLGARLHCDMSE
ncbi:MAG TPA: hypothetical protein VIV60_04010, partial [Polyangiaceae bacterium]